MTFSQLKSKIYNDKIYFAVMYSILCFFTYILPYFGSNSLVAFGLLMGKTLIFVLTHLTLIVGMSYISYRRGQNIKKEWLYLLPVTAGIFDFVPLFNWIPLVPSFIHIAVIYTNALSKKESATVVVS